MRQFGQVTPCRDHSIWTSVCCQQVARLVERRSRCEQPRAANRDDDVLEQAFGDQTRIFAGAETDGDVDVVMAEVAQLAGYVEAQLDVGAQFAEQVDPRHQPFRGEHGVHGELELGRAARQLAGPRHRKAEAAQRLDGGRVDDRSGLGELHHAAGADKQQHAQLVLDFLDLMADRRRRQPELVRCAREIEVAGSRVECPQRARSGNLGHLSIFK